MTEYNSATRNPWVDQEGRGRAQAIYESMLESITDGVVAVDLDGTIIFVNDAAEEMMQWRREQADGQKITEVSKLLDKKGAYVKEKNHPLQLALDLREKVIAQHYVLPRPSPTVKDTQLAVHITAAPVMMGDDMVGAVAVFRDVTEERENNRMKDEFLGIASHELRTPMTAIMGNVDMLLKGEAGAIDATQKEYLQDIEKGADRLIKLVHELLDASRLDAGRIQFTLQDDVAVDQLIAEVIATLAQTAENKGLRLVFEKTKGALPLVMSDRDKVIAVLNNLIGNALKYTVSGSVTVTAIAECDDVNVSVTDTGVGIRPEDTGKLFKKFSRLESELSEKVESTGMGLYITKQMLLRLGGDIWVTSEGEGKGSTFGFSLPRAGSKKAAFVRGEIGNGS